jgi:hypothetical protein
MNKPTIALMLIALQSARLSIWIRVQLENSLWVASISDANTRFIKTASMIPHIFGSKCSSTCFLKERGYH